MRALLRIALAACLVTPAMAGACSAGGNTGDGTGAGSGTAGSGGIGSCDVCVGSTYTPCSGAPIECPDSCAAGVGCVLCVPGANVCVGDEVHKCADDGQSQDELVTTCDTAAGEACWNGECAPACQVASDQPANVGCEFWAVDLDQQDGFNDPASEPWGVVLSNASDAPAHVRVELNTAPVGSPLALALVTEIDVPADGLETITLPTRELDCGIQPNDYASPGTCLSSNAIRITASNPIVVYQFNVFTNAYSNDASLLLPTNALGNYYRIIGWPAGHPVKIVFPGLPEIIDRSYVTIVGTKPNTQVTVTPSWRIKGNGSIPATAAGGLITATIGPFDVLNLETDDGTFQDDPKTIADLSGTAVTSTEPVAVFSGVETTSAPGGVLDIPTYGGWTDGDTCCLDHLEDQMFPIESVGTHFVITRSPVRSTSSYREPDVLRFVGVAEAANVQTTLPPPFDAFTILPGEVRTTWTQDNVAVTCDKPVMIGQILISNQYVDGPYIGDPSLTVFPPVEQFRSEYVFLTPPSWTQNWVVIAAEVGATVELDFVDTASCLTELAGTIEGVTYQSRRCAVSQGVHRISGDTPFGITAYGYGSAGSYAFSGGADVKRIYVPPPIN